MDINFEYYKIFYYAAKYRNITRAAAALGSNQPNVTRILKLLEAQLHCRLFTREARGISLTEEGELLYAHVEVAYSHLLNAQEELCRLDSRRCGTVEIGATETALHLFLLPALHGFRLEYPAIRVKIHNHPTRETARQLLSGKLDFAVITTPFAPPASCSCRGVLDFEEILVGGTQYGHLCSSPVALGELKQYAWVGLGRGSVTYDLYRNFFIGHGVDMELDMEVASSGLMLPLIEHNFGIGFVPEQLALPLLEENRLVRIPLDCAAPRRAIQIVSDKGRGKSLAADTLYKYLTHL